MIEVVIDRLPDLDSKHTQRYLEKVHKLVKLNTYILAEQVLYLASQLSDLVWRKVYPYLYLNLSTDKTIKISLK